MLRQRSPLPKLYKMKLSRPHPIPPPLPLLPKEILSRLRRTKLACNVPSQTCMLHNDYLDIVADLQLFHVAAGRKSFSPHTGTM